ncbi:hypothetical protein MANES_11G082995v8 [Manihot esculenta]|uniref:Uncharacterized protein n=1 Tax=Manihot esculenta TaxID=3983 RepID=A0ACB7GW19_MANES|nr:hypothetical protein MANES_11G082995v8 [Manihot esculenta]
MVAFCTPQYLCELHLAGSGKFGRPGGMPSPLAARLPAAGPLLRMQIAFCVLQCLYKPHLGSRLHICEPHLLAGQLACLPAGLYASEPYLGAGTCALQLPRARAVLHQHCSHEPRFCNAGLVLSSSQQPVSSQLGLALPPVAYQCSSGPTTPPATLPIDAEPQPIRD